MLETEINLSAARNHIVGLLVPEIGAMHRKSFAEHQRARVESKISPIEVRSKNDKSFETTNSDDINVDQVIQQRLGDAFPDIPYLSEDSPDSRLRDLDPDRLRRIPLMWVVDARDGTGPFENYDEEFSTSIALVSYGRTILGILHKPMNNTTWWAQADEEGAYKNGERIFVSETDSLRKSMLSRPYSWDLKEREETDRLGTYLSPRVHQPGINNASSALDMIRVADGRIAGFYGRGLKPWDIAASSFITEKAGGRSTNYEGKQGDVFTNDNLITNGIIHDELLEAVREFEESKGNRMQNPRQTLKELLSKPIHVVGQVTRPVREIAGTARQIATFGVAASMMLLNLAGHGFGRLRR